jgi:hypothetical protein
MELCQNVFLGTVPLELQELAKYKAFRFKVKEVPHSDKP